MKIPPGTQPGQKFRLKERGLPKGDSIRGDLYVVAEVELPKHLSPEQKVLWEQLAETK